MRLLLPLAAGAVLAAGCGTSTPAPPKRGPVAGKVTLDGKPVARGNVRFIALFPDGVNALAPVSNGTYSLDAANGLMKGRYRVEFSIPAGRMRRTANPDSPGEWLEEPQETLPARYHKDSTFTLDYDPDVPATFDGELRSQ